eukprot:12270210-Alexandrium_andersonii.AAC.1
MLPSSAGRASSVMSERDSLARLLLSASPGALGGTPSVFDATQTVAFRLAFREAGLAPALAICPEELRRHARSA